MVSREYRDARPSNKCRRGCANGLPAELLAELRNVWAWPVVIGEELAVADSNCGQGFSRPQCGEVGEGANLEGHLIERPQIHGWAERSRPVEKRSPRA
jgi:hypothetical protein